MLAVHRQPTRTEEAIYTRMLLFQKRFLRSVNICAIRNDADSAIPPPPSANDTSLLAASFVSYSARGNYPIRRRNRITDTRIFSSLLYQLIPLTLAT